MNIAPTIDSNERFADFPPRTIAVLRALQLGDLLCLVPALRALRSAVPQAKITLIGLPWVAGFVQRFSAYVDDYMIFPGMPGMPEQEAQEQELPQFIASARERQFDLAIQLHGDGTLTNPLLLQLGATHNAGFYMPSNECPDPARFLPWITHEHEVLRALRLMEFLGIDARGTELEFPLFDADYRALQNSTDMALVSGAYAIIHPGARLPSRRWLPQRFAQVADYLAEEGLKIVLTGSPDEQPLTSAVKAAMRTPAVDLTGKTELGTMAALIAGARIVVCNDTGISHLTAAVATPSAVICSGADPQRWAPLNRVRHRTLYHDVTCRPCMHFVCPIGHPCANGVTVDMVWNQVRDVLATNGKSNSILMQDRVAPGLRSQQ